MAEEIVLKFKKFAAKSRDAYSEMYDRIRTDRAFMPFLLQHLLQFQDTLT